jgi:hypothetical protein
MSTILYYKMPVFTIGKGRETKAEGRGQRAEGRGQRAEGRGQRKNPSYALWQKIKLYGFAKNAA